MRQHAPLGCAGDNHSSPLSLVSARPHFWFVWSNCYCAGKMTSKTVVRLCLDKLRTFIENPDQNRESLLSSARFRVLTQSWCLCLAVKYLGLLGLHKLMRANQRAVAGT